MPVARPPLKPVPPIPLKIEEVDFVKQTIVRWFGENAVIRNFGPDPDLVELHVEADQLLGHLVLADCLGVLLTRIDRRKGVHLSQSKRGHPSMRGAKIAYRQGVVI